MIALDRTRLTGVLPLRSFDTAAFGRAGSGLKRIRTQLKWHGGRYSKEYGQGDFENTVSETRFTPEMTVDQAFKVHAGARRVRC